MLYFLWIDGIPFLKPETVSCVLRGHWFQWLNWTTRRLIRVRVWICRARFLLSSSCNEFIFAYPSKRGLLLWGIVHRRGGGDGGGHFPLSFWKKDFGLTPLQLETLLGGKILDVSVGRVFFFWGGGLTGLRKVRSTSGEESFLIKRGLPDRP